jgi:site-specific DNA recombinase
LFLAITGGCRWRARRRRAKSRAWIDDIRLGHLGSFQEITAREDQGELHIRLPAPLAFLSPRIVAAIADGTAPADLAVTGLAKARPYSWAEQERHIGLAQQDPVNA